MSTQDGYFVQLTFEAFDLEPGDCSYDFVEVSYDSYSTKFCGDSIPGPFESTNTTMNVKIKTDSSVTGQGFKAEWTSKLQPCSCGIEFDSAQKRIVGGADLNSVSCSRVEFQYNMYLVNISDQQVPMAGETIQKIPWYL